MNAFQEAIKALLVKARDEGMTRREAAEAFGLTYEAVAIRIRGFGIDWPHGNTSADSPHSERNETIIARHQAGETLEAIGVDYGLTRERVRQIAKNGGAPSKNQMKRAALVRLADFLKANPMTLSEASQELGIATYKLHEAANIAGVKFLKMSPDQEAKLAAMAELVRGGASFRTASGKSSNLARLLKAYCDERGIKSHVSTRWSVSPRRGEVICKLYAQGKNWKEISDAVEILEDVTFKGGAVQTWAYNNLELPRRVAAPKPCKEHISRQPKSPQPVGRRLIGSVEVDVRSSVRETAIVNRGKATASQIAAACGTTRNSVIGYWNRARQIGVIA